MYFDKTAKKYGFLPRIQEEVMAYNRRNYNSYNNNKIHVSRRLRNRAIIIAVGIVVFALIVALISSILSCVCTGTTKTEPTIDTATVGTGTNAKQTAKKTTDDSIKFKEPEIRDTDTSSEGVFDGDYYVWNSKAFEAFKGSKSNAKEYAEVINGTKSRLGTKVNVYSELVPTHIEMGLPNRLKNTENGIKTKSQADYIKAAYKSLDKKVKYINCYNLMSEHCNDYIFFDSDYNPTGLGGYCVYRSFVQSINKKPISLGNCTEGTVENFYGYYNNFLDTELNVDSVHYWDFNYKVTNQITTADDEEETAYSCYNKEAETGAGAYNVFLYGKNPLEVIKSENSTASGKIAIIHNNTGNSSVPYFTYNYEEVYSVDYTVYKGDLKKLCDENGITNVLFLNDTDSSSDADQLSKLKAFTAVG